MRLAFPLVSGFMGGSLHMQSQGSQWDREEFCDMLGDRNFRLGLLVLVSVMLMKRLTFA